MKAETLGKIVGEVKDEFYVKDENGEDVLVKETDWKKNTVLVGMSVIVSMLLNNEGGFSGIQYHGLGSGDAAWDTTVVDPDFTDTTLLAESYRKIPDSVVYVDQAGDPSVSPTNRLLVTTTFDYGEATGSIREQGIFAGDATASADSGLLMNCIRHKEIYKGLGEKLIRRIRFTFGS